MQLYFSQKFVLPLLAVGIVISIFILGKNHTALPESVVDARGHYRFNYRGEEAERAQRGAFTPREWDEYAHGAQLGFDWRAAQAAELQRIQAEYYAPGAQSRSNQYGPFTAQWIERGPSKIPGRVTGSEVLPLQNRVYLLTDGGYLFRGTLAGDDWLCLNDHHPLGRGVDARLEVVPLPTGANRILAGGWDAQNLGPGFLQYSDDEGATWQTPTGLPACAWYRRTIASADGAVFHMVRTDAGGSPHMNIYRSTDYGSSFALWYSRPLTLGWYDRRCDLWKPADSDTLFTVFEDHFIKIDPSGNAVDLGTITNQPDPEWAILTGGRASANEPFMLYLRVWDGTDNAIYRSTNGGQTWAPWGSLGDGGLLWPFSNYAFATNPADPTRVYAGGWILGDSGDGASWHYPHDLGGYVGYHGDVPDINFTLNPATGTHDLYIGTDGGYYEYRPQDDTFESLSIETLNNTQIYKMASSHTEEWRMYIGTQDNGFNYNATPTDWNAPAPFSYLWGGDVTQLVSGDGGQSFWCFWIGGGGNYVQTAANIANSGVANGAPLYDPGYWEMPAAADPHNGRQCWVAGYRPNAAEGSFLTRLKAPDNLPDGAVQPFEINYGAYNFQSAPNGGKIGAIGVSPLDANHLYVMTENGTFFWSLDGGTTWQQNTAATGKIFPRYIRVSPTVPGEVFIGGAAYGNNAPVWRASEHGVTLAAAEPAAVSVLKNNRVNALCFDPTGAYVFAAADIGAFVYVLAENKWQFIGGAPAPVTHFHDVEYLEATNTVRFATYARGVWDFKIEETTTGVAPAQTATPDLRVFPNPCTNFCIVDLTPWDSQPVEITVVDASGRTVQRFTHAAGDGHTRRLPLTGWAPGAYTVMVRGKGEGRSGKVVVR